MPDIGKGEQKMFSALKKPKRESGTNCYTGINAMECHRNTKTKHLTQNGKGIMPAKVSRVECCQVCLASIWKQAASYDQSNLECECARVMEQCGYKV